MEIFQFFTASPGWANKNRANFPDLVKTHLPNLVSPKVVLRLSDRALILFLSFCKLSEVLKYIYMSNKNRERSRRY